jgi:hypothetical protein
VAERRRRGMEAILLGERERFTMRSVEEMKIERFKAYLTPFKNLTMRSDEEMKIERFRVYLT